MPSETILVPWRWGTSMGSKPDLAVANLGNGISVLLGDGDGTFQAAVSYVAGSIPSSVAVGLQWGRQSRSGGGELWRQQRNDTSQHHCPGSAKGATSTTLTSSLNPSNVGHSEAIHDEISPSIVPISQGLGWAIDLEIAGHNADLRGVPGTGERANHRVRDVQRARYASRHRFLHSAEPDIHLLSQTPKSLHRRWSLCSLPVPKQFVENLGRVISFAQSAIGRTWQSAHFVHPVSFGGIYAAAVLRSSAGVKSLCCRSTASRYATIFRATASVARLPFPFCLSLS